MIIGTSHFLTLGYATLYYKRQGFSVDDVRAKLASGEIALGASGIKTMPGDQIRTNSEGRFVIVTKD